MKRNIGFKIIMIEIVELDQLIMNFRLYIIFNKHNDDKYWRSNQRKIGSVIARARIILLPTVRIKYVKIVSLMLATKLLFFLQLLSL